MTSYPLPYRITVGAGGMSAILRSYKVWMSENVGERFKDWQCFWQEGEWYEISFKEAQDLTAFKLRFKL